MHWTRWTTMALISILLGWGREALPPTAPLPQTSPLEIELTTVQTEATVGAPVTWLVALTPRGERIGPVVFRPDDTGAWHWVNDPITITAEALTSPVVVKVSAAPLVSGELTPILEAHYVVGQASQMRLVKADAPLQVQPVETTVETGILAQKGTASKWDLLPIDVWIRNDSPFTLTQVEMRGAGVDLAWNVLPDPFAIPPDTTSHQAVTATVVGQHPQPHLSIQYEWTDVEGGHTGELMIKGDPVLLEEGAIESIIGRIPDEVFGIIVGLLIGALTGFVEDWVSRTIQRRTNWQHLQGLLQMTVMEARHAAENSVEIDLTPLKTVFENEGLFTMAEEKRLAHHVRDLWKTAKRHNQGLDQPGGAQRTNELRDAADKLDKKLKRWTVADRAH